ncbi:MAG: hypothetical protein WC856_13750 [Methylococcaceae bacterium]|jgi:hypothetical protein
MAMKDISDVQVCQAYKDARAVDWKYPDGSECWPHTLLMKRTGQCEKVCLMAMERAAERGFIDYGVTLRSGWLTEKGEELLSHI